MLVKSVRPLSLAKILAFIFGFIGLILGALTSVLTLLGVSLVKTSDTGPESLAGILAVVILPPIYALIGFIVGVINAALFNVAAGWMGGLEMKTAEEIKV